jgi:predicted AAA+ superfamily ATPase
MIINRRIGPEIIELSRQFPVITITGPRHSGKTTLARMLFPDTAYANLEDMQQRDFALNDPKGFLEQFPNGAVIDEIQRAPDLCSYIQVTVDQKKKNGLFILTGSHQFEMISKISQSLAGRTAIIRLLPFDLKEAYPSINQNSKLLDILYTGFYPRIFSDNINPSKFYSFYVSTYIERDLRQIINIKDLSRFETFIRLCAGRIGQIINYTSISNECGVDQNTIKSWLSVLEASYICRLLKPYYKNIGKRLVKAPKIYFYDSGLVCFLLGITNPEHLQNHPLFGNIFENFIVSEIIKNIFNKVETEHLFFFRDHTGNEVDIVFDNITSIDQVEIKAAKTIHNSFLSPLRYLQTRGIQVNSSYLVYGGEKSYTRENIHIKSWTHISDI